MTTVISGGFPGRVAQEVYPNQKCEGCLHYDAQAGRTGACTVGLRPDNCGDGEAPAFSYAPIVRGAGSYLPDMGNHGAHAPEVDPQHVGGLYGSGSTRPLVIQQVSLGEEQLHVVKSMVERHTELQKSQCLQCSTRGSAGPYNNDPQACTCRPLEAEVVAKAVVGRMSNALRARVPLDAVTQWVRDVAKAGFRLPAPGTSAPRDERPRQSIADKTRLEDTGGHLRPAKKSAPAPATEVVAKSLYSDDWICQFKGTSLFDEARKLCERELEEEEKDLKHSEERLKHEKTHRTMLDKLPKLESEDWQAMESRRTKIRIAKQRLTLKLAGIHQEKLSVSKSLAFKPHPESPKNSTARASHGEYEISPTSSGLHRLDYYAGSGDHPAHTEHFRSHSAAVKHADIHNSKVSAASSAKAPAAKAR